MLDNTDKENTNIKSKVIIKNINSYFINVKKINITKKSEKNSNKKSTFLNDSKNENEKPKNDLDYKNETIRKIYSNEKDFNIGFNITKKKRNSIKLENLLITVSNKGKEYDYANPELALLIKMIKNKGDNQKNEFIEINENIENIENNQINKCDDIINSKIRTINSLPNSTKVKSNIASYNYNNIEENENKSFKKKKEIIESNKTNVNKKSKKKFFCCL